MGRPVYVPILKWNKCEKDALRALEPDIKPKLLPCIEVRKEISARTFFAEFQFYWGRNSILDISNPEGQLNGTRRKLTLELLSMFVNSGFDIYPAIDPIQIDLLKDVQLNSVVKRIGQYCLRLRLDINSNVDKIKKKLILFLKNTAPNQRIIMIVDLGPTPNVTDFQNSQITELLAYFIGQQSIFSVHLASGAFPETLVEIGVGPGEIARRDWGLWRAIASAPSLQKLGYSDYTAVNPNWTEEVTLKKGPISIKYTIDESWLILRGETNEGAEGIRLCKLFLFIFKDHYKGPVFSEGDRQMWLKSKGDPSLERYTRNGSAAYVFEAIVHHISFVIKHQQSETCSSEKGFRSTLF